MNPSPLAPLPPELRTAAGTLASKLRLILTGLEALLSLRLLRTPARALYIRPLANLIARTLHRFTRLMDRLAAGRPLPAPRPRAPHPAPHPAPRLAQRPAAKPPVPHPVSPLPRRPGWLIAAIVNEAACFQSQLESLLATPEAQAILAASPAALRILAPIRRLLHIEPYDGLQPLRVFPSRPTAPWLPPPGPPRIRLPRPQPPFAWLHLPSPSVQKTPTPA